MRRLILFLLHSAAEAAKPTLTCTVTPTSPSNTDTTNSLNQAFYLAIESDLEITNSGAGAAVTLTGGTATAPSCSDLNNKFEKVGTKWMAFAKITVTTQEAGTQLVVTIPADCLRSSSDAADGNDAQTDRKSVV